MTGINDEVEIYSPEVSLEYENNIPKESIENENSDFDEITDSNGDINIVINSQVVGQTLATKIYTSYLSGMRELVNNELRACRMAKKMGGNPKLVITINPNPEVRTLTIQGVDSLGITKAMFAKVLRVIGKSGNTDGNEIGQFGMGFISYCLLSDAVILETYARETNEHYSMLCDSGLKYKLIPTDKSNDINVMSDYGTKISMTCKDSVTFSDIISLVKKLVRFQGIPTSIILTDDVMSDSYYDKSVLYEKGVIECKLYKTMMDYLKDNSKYKERLLNSSRDDSSTVKFHDEVVIDTDDYRLEGIISLMENRYGNIHLFTTVNSRFTSNILLAGTPIDNAIDSSMFTSVMVNIKNERKFKPVASRDTLERDSHENLKSMIEDDLRKYMTKYNLESVDDYLKSINKALYTSEIHYNTRDFFSEETNRLVETLNAYYMCDDGYSKNLSSMLASSRPLVALKSLRRSLMEVIKPSIEESVGNNCLFFRIPTKLSNERRAHVISFFKSLGIYIGDEYKKEMKLKETQVIRKDGRTISTDAKPIVIYNSNVGVIDEDLFGSRYGWRANANKYSTKIGLVNNNNHKYLIRVHTGYWKSTYDIINSMRTDYKILHDIKGLSKKVLTLDEILISCDKTNYQTNDGLVKGKDLEGEYTAVITDEPERLHGVKGIDKDIKLIAVKDENDMLLLKLYDFWQENINGKKDRFNIVRGNYTSGIDSNIILQLSININRSLSSRDKDIITMYWLEQILPIKYAEVFCKSYSKDDECSSAEILSLARKFVSELRGY